MEHPAAVEALAEEFSWAGADITQTFTYYSRDVGTPEDCSLTVSDLYGEFDHYFWKKLPRHFFEKNVGQTRNCEFPIVGIQRGAVT